VWLDIISNSDAGLATGADVYISEIDIGYNSSDHLYTPVDGKLSATADLVEGEEGNVFLSGFDVEFKGIEIGDTEDVKLKPSGNDNYKVEFYTKAGDKISQEYCGHNTSTLVALGRKSGSSFRDIVTSATVPVHDEDYVIIGDGSTGGYGRILQFKSVQNGDDIYRIKDIGSGEVYDVSYDSNGQGTLVVDGFSTTIKGQGDSGTSLNFSTAKNNIYTQYGAKLTFAATTTAGGNCTVTMLSETAEDGSTRDTLAFRVYYDSTNSEMQLRSYSDATGVSMTKVDDKDEYEGYSQHYGIKAHFNSPTTGQRDVTLTYPDDQATFAVFYTGAEVTEGGTTEGTYTEKVVPIPVSASKLASEVADITAQNALVVGGPCVNPAAATLMGNPENCVEGFTEGKAMIKLFENDGNVALLVAGYAALDTRRATTVLANHADYAGDLVGTEVVVSGTTLSDIMVSQPVAEEVAEEVVEEVVEEVTE
jgi:hypothetical protein